MIVKNIPSFYKSLKSLKLIYKPQKLKFRCVDCGNCCDQSLIINSNKSNKMVVPIYKFNLDSLGENKSILGLKLPFYMIVNIIIEQNEDIIWKKKFFF